MKAYFTASIAGKKQYLSHYTQIIDLLKKRGIEVNADHIIGVSEEQLDSQTKEQRISFQAKLDQWISSCDFMIAETSYPSIGVGYEISLALTMQKPVLILYSGKNPPSLLAHHKDTNFVCEQYTTDTLPAILDDYLAYIKGSSDTRFTFFITPAIAAFLEKVSRKQKLPKSVYLRKLIEADMQSH